MNEQDPYQEFYNDNADFNYDGAEQHFKEQTEKNAAKKKDVDFQWSQIQDIVATIGLISLLSKPVVSAVKRTKNQLIITTTEKTIIIEALVDENGSASIEVSS